VNRKRFDAESKLIRWDTQKLASKSGRTLGDVILPDGMNLNQELVKQGWCWWYRKYAPEDSVLDGWRRKHERVEGLWPIRIPCRRGSAYMQSSSTNGGGLDVDE
jgi:endonuclease YncB( thermonuclease family)